MSSPTEVSEASTLQVERMDLLPTVRALEEAEHYLDHLVSVLGKSTPASITLIKVRAERLRVQALLAESSIGPIETLRKAHPRRYDAVDGVYWGCVACGEDTGVPFNAEMHQRIWESRPGEPLDRRRDQAVGVRDQQRLADTSAPGRGGGRESPLRALADSLW